MQEKVHVKNLNVMQSARALTVEAPATAECRPSVVCRSKARHRRSPAPGTRPRDTADDNLRRSSQ